jgi:hypothetical protein
MRRGNTSGSRFPTCLPLLADLSFGDPPICSRPESVSRHDRSRHSCKHERFPNGPFRRFVPTFRTPHGKPRDTLPIGSHRLPCPFRRHRLMRRSPIPEMTQRRPLIRFGTGLPPEDDDLAPPRLFRRQVGGLAPRKRDVRPSVSVRPWSAFGGFDLLQGRLPPHSRAFARLRSSRPESEGFVRPGYVRFRALHRFGKPTRFRTLPRPHPKCPRLPDLRTLPKQHPRGRVDFERVPTRTTAAFPAMGLGQAFQRIPPAYPRYPPCFDRSVRRPACLSSAPLPSDRPEGRPDFCGRHRGPGPAFKGLSYVGIRASIRRLLPRRLEPILSWVFTPLGFSLFLP